MVEPLVADVGVREGEEELQVGNLDGVTVGIMVESGTV